VPPGKYDKDDYHDGQIVIVKPGQDEYGTFGYGYDDRLIKKDSYDTPLAYDSGYGSRLDKIPIYSLDKYSGLSKLALTSEGGYGKGAALYADEGEQEKGYDSGYGEGLSVIPGKFKEIYFDGGYGKLDVKKYAPAKTYAASSGYDSYAPPKKYATSGGYESGRTLDLGSYGKGLVVPSYRKAAQVSDYGREDLRAAYSKAYDRLAAYEKEALPVAYEKEALPAAYGRGYDSGYDEDAPRYAGRY
jgi:hypothetical protein